MHFEILIEDKSGEQALTHLLPKIIPHISYRMHSYKGIGGVPTGLKTHKNAKSAQLLNDLPRILRGYGKTYCGNAQCAVIIVCDLDDKNEEEFRRQLTEIHNNCTPKPCAYFLFAIEEMEAWLLGDKEAVKTAYKNYNKAALNDYSYDSICGTWEVLADTVHPGGSKALSAQPFHIVGTEKFKWADKIAPLIDVENNQSPSFQKFRDTLRALENGELPLN